MSNELIVDLILQFLCFLVGLALGLGARNRVLYKIYEKGKCRECNKTGEHHPNCPIGRLGL